MRARLLAVAATLTLSACGGSSTSTVGPLTIDPPPGWLVTLRQPGTIKITNGTVADGTSSKRGTATAVFDIYVDSAQSLREFRQVLKDNNVSSTQERMEIDGYDAVIVTSKDSAFAPPLQTVFIPDWDVRIVYRAAHPDDKAGFARNSGGFRDALRTITFRGRPPA